MSHDDYETMQQQSDPTISTPATDSSTDTDSVTAFTFDEIGLLAGVTTPTGLDETKTLMVTHVTFHPVLLSANRTIVIDYTITIQLS
jgi:kynurenine formamidase